MSITCPKCHYQRKPTDIAPEYECPNCGVIYAKATMERAGIRVLTPSSRAGEPRSHTETPEIQQIVITDVQIPFKAMFRLCFQFSLAAIPAAVVAALVVYGILFATGGLGALLGKLIFR